MNTAKRFVSVMLAVMMCVSVLANPLAAVAHAEQPAVPATTPAETPSDDPVDTSADIPADAPADVPVDTPVDIPADVPADVPVDTPVDIPADVPADVPEDALDTPTVAFAAAPAAETGPKEGLVNLALNKPAVASTEEASSVVAQNATDGDSTDGASRWGSARGEGPEWIYVDLGDVKNIQQVEIFWESGKASKYAIQVADTLPASDDAAAWTTVKAFDTHPADIHDLITLDQPVFARYVRLYIETITNEDPLNVTVPWPTISIFELKVFGDPNAKAPEPEPEEPQNPQENVALHKLAVASSIEADTVKAENATDGNTTSRDSRWGSDTNGAPHWIYVDLGKEMNVQTVRLYWEQRKPTSYVIQLANTAAAPTEESQWETVINLHRRPATKNETITLPEVHRARFVRLLINGFTHEDPDGGDTWPAVSIYEMEVYGGIPARSYTLEEALEQVVVTPPVKGDAKLNVTLPTIEGVTVEYNGTDLEQVIGDDLTIYQPLVDKTVKVSFKATSVANKENFAFREVSVTVPGANTVTEQDNPAPNVLPEVQEWKGSTGYFTLTEHSNVLYSENALFDIVWQLRDDYKEITGRYMNMDTGDIADAMPGDIVLVLNPELEPSLQKEGYRMTIGNYVRIEAADPAGVFYATRTLFQCLKQDGKAPKGTVRDYPEYEVRGFMLDVGRKPISMGFLKQLVKQMSWYKMNDLQIHLNDNYIWLEELDDPMSAYSAFRLESDVKKGGNGGKNQADLTSKDLFYTKDEFRLFIEEARTFGVNIVPEIDTPAHSLALTKVRPDLRQGTTGRQNDHLNLTDKYNESTAFVKSIFSEYMEGDMPTFDQQTTIHVGADEYEANKEAYRRFADDMLGFVQDSGRKARIWGSLSQLDGTTPVRSEGVQMQLWNARWADMKQMYIDGFDLINCNDADYYIVPNAGYYHDYLPDENMYDLDINQIGNFRIPSGDKQMVGGMFAVWNDMIGARDNGVSEYDIYLRIKDAMPLFAAKLWGKGDKTLAEAKATDAAVGDALCTNFSGKVNDWYGNSLEGKNILHWTMDNAMDNTQNGYDLAGMTNASYLELNFFRRLMKLNGGESYAQTRLPYVGLDHDLRIKVLRTSASTEDQILMENDTIALKAVQKGTGKVGFTRECVDYSFDYTLPMYQWVELEFKNEENQISLWVNGEHVDTIGDDEMVNGRPLLANVMLPTERVGSKTHAFIGYVDDLRIGPNKEYNTTMKLDPLVFAAEHIQDSTSNYELSEAVDTAVRTLNTFDPTQEEIQASIDALSTLMQGIDYTRADYTYVDKYLALVPEDLSLFTADSIKALQQALEGIQRELPRTMQHQVDLQGEAIRLALDGLKPRSAQDLAFVDPETMTATASSYQKDGSSPDKVLDGNLNTMWHTDWNITTMPHWIDLEMAKPTAVNGLIYTPRQGNSNGRATSYRIEKSDDGVHYTEVTSGRWANTDADKEVSFEPVVAKHIRLVILTAGNNNGSAVEIRLKAVRDAADVAGLNALIAQADKLTAADYTPESWAKLETALNAAKTTAQAQNPDAEAVDTAKRNLILAMGDLVLPARPEKDQAVKDVMTQIDALGGYSLDEQADVKAARAAYEKLTPEQKKQVDNIDKLIFTEKRMASMYELNAFGMSIGKNLNLNFYAQFSEELIERGEVQIAAPGKPVRTYTIKGMTTDSDGDYMFTGEVSVRNMAEPVEMTVLLDGKPVEAPDAMSVRDYSGFLLSGGPDENGNYNDMQEMMRSTLYYGAQMQVYKNYKTDNLATDGMQNVEALEEAANAVKLEELEKYRPTVSGALDEKDLKLHGMNLNLDSKTTLRYFFDKGAGYDAKDYTFKVGDEVLTPKENGKFVCVELDGISAQYLDEMPELTVTGKGKTMVVKYGAMSYVRSALKKGDTDLHKVVRAMTVFNADANVLEAKNAQK